MDRKNNSKRKTAKKPTEPKKKPPVSSRQELEAYRVLAPLLALYPPISPNNIRCPLCPPGSRQHIFPKWFYLLRHFRRKFNHRDDKVVIGCGLIPSSSSNQPSPSDQSDEEDFENTPPPLAPETNQEESQSHPCTQCSKRFINQHFLALHMERGHQNQGQSQSPTPPIESSILQKHDQQHHNIPCLSIDNDAGVICRYCLKGFRDTKSLQIEHVSCRKRRQDEVIDEERKKKRGDNFSSRVDRVVELEAMRKFSIPIENLRLPRDLMVEKTFIINEVGGGGSGGGGGRGTLLGREIRTFDQSGDGGLLGGGGVRVIELVEAVERSDSSNDLVVDLGCQLDQLSPARTPANPQIPTHTFEDTLPDNPTKNDPDYFSYYSDGVRDQNYSQEEAQQPAIDTAGRRDIVFNVHESDIQPEWVASEEKLKSSILKHNVRRVLQNLCLGDYEKEEPDPNKKPYACNLCEDEFDTVSEKNEHLKKKHSYFYLHLRRTGAVQSSIQMEEGGENTGKKRKLTTKTPKAKKKEDLEKKV